MPNCPHCGKDTSAETPAPARTIEAGAQLYRQRKQGAQILPGEQTPDSFPASDNAA